MVISTVRNRCAVFHMEVSTEVKTMHGDAGGRGEEDGTSDKGSTGSQPPCHVVLKAPF